MIVPPTVKDMTDAAVQSEPLVLSEIKYETDVPVCTAGEGIEEEIAG